MPETGDGTVERAVAEHGFSPETSFVVGDDVCDIELRRACGASTLLVRSGYGERVLAETSLDPDHVVKDLLEAAEVIRDILRSRGRSSRDGSE